MNMKTSARIARRMKELHAGIPISSKERELGPSAVKNIKDWISTIEGWIANDNFDYKNTNELKLFKMGFPKFKQCAFKYIEWIEKKYDKSTYKDLVFCHNDTQYGNLLFSTSPIKLEPPQVSERPRTAASQTSLIKTLSNLSLENLPEQLNPSVQEKKQDQNLVVIDFEYSGPNFPGFDIANHFCEWMHDYNHPTASYAIDTNDFPSIEEQLNFNYSYVLFRNPEFVDITKANTQNLRVLETQSRLIYNQVIDWRPAVSLFWSLWAILQSGPKNSKSHDDIIESGFHGEKYKIVFDDEDNIGDDFLDHEIDEGVEGSADNDNFEYLLYAKEKIEVFLGDVTQLGIVSIQEIEESSREELKYLTVDYFDV
jgi:choline kinase